MSVNQYLISKIKWKRCFNSYLYLKFPFSCSISNSGCRTSAKLGQSCWSKLADYVLESEKLI